MTGYPTARRLGIVALFFNDYEMKFETPSLLKTGRLCQIWGNCVIAKRGQLQSSTHVDGV